MIRLVHLIKRGLGETQETFTSRWRDVHGPLVAASQTALRISRYVQTHRDSAAEDMVRGATEARGDLLPPVDGIEEYWWNSEAELAEAMESRAGRDAYSSLLESERRFIDLAKSTLWTGHEFPQVSTGLQRAVAYSKTPILKLNFAINPLASMTEAAARHYWLTQHGPLVRSHSGARGLIAYTQVHRFPSATAERWSGDRASAPGGFMGHAEAWFDRSSSRIGPEVEAAKSAAIEDEANFINWGGSTILFGKELIFVDRYWL